MKTKTNKVERMAQWAGALEVARGKLTESKLPSAAIIETALDGMLKSNGGMLKNAPSFRERPLASLLHRLIAWNNSGGNLWGLFSTKQDAETLARFDDSFHDWWKAPKSRMAEHKALIGDMSGDALHDQLETMAMVLCGGSRAADRWQKALGW
tara:strand:+ start:52 stop:510 length:459 start_codon:yes stop_codon:yes gene_type:complete